MKTYRKSFKVDVLASGALMSVLGMASAATVDQADWSNLNARAAGGKAVPVVIDVASVSLVELKHQAQKVKGRVASAAARVRSELGQDLWAESISQSDGGQMTAYVTQRGMQYLKNSSNALAFREGSEWYTNSLLHRSAESLARLDKAADTPTGAEALITLNVEGLEHVYDADGSVRFVADPLAAGALSALVDRLQQAVAAIPGSQAAEALRTAAARAATVANGFDPTIRVRLTKRELVAIARSDAVRDLRLADEGEGATISRPDEALASASAYGYADVIVTIRPAIEQGNLSEASTRAHWKSVQATMEAIRSAHGGMPGLVPLPAVDAMVGRVTHADMLALAKSADKRLANVSLNKPLGSPALSVSNPTIGTPLVWNTLGSAGYIDGAGSTVVVMDSGVQSSHQFLRGLPIGGTRVTRQRCFGTTNPSANLLSVCPGTQDGSFNSSGPASGEAFVSCPYSPSTRCSHGTSVAGVAAGGSIGQIGFSFFYNNRSVAFASNIWSYNVYSKSGSGSTIASIDMLEALNDVIFATTSGTTANKVVINISFERRRYSTVCSGSSSEVAADDLALYNSVQSAVNTLYARGIAVVAAVGNQSWIGEVGFPSCLAKVVKVGGTPNDGIANKTVERSNLPNPAAFPGDYIWMLPGGGSVRGSTVVSNINMPVATDPAGFAWDTNNGTSFAAPHVAGLFALYKSTVPAATITDIGNYLNGVGRTYNVSGMQTPTQVYKTYKGIRFTAL